MHGRVKVRTTEEEKARKEKERQEKLKIFKHAMHKIQHKRKEAEFDKDLLELTGKVLSSNPDIYTLWNVRREILSIFKKQNEADQELSRLYDAELQLTEYCLKINPKSYGAWHQREWVLTTRSNPDWQKELTLCNIYLKLDERNFHTWDYRRFVVSKCNPSLKDEFNFTTEKLYDNFSNYSAWHYRSKILVELYPDLEGGRPIADTHHKQELKIVQSAAFTDPDDTSAWFYQRWLLGAVRMTTKVVVYVVTPVKITIAFNKYVEQKFVESKIRIYCNKDLIQGDLVPCTKNQYDILWILTGHDAKVTENDDIRLEYDMEDGNIQNVPSIKLNSYTYVGKTDISFERNYSKPVVEELNSQLSSCRQLLAMEPDNKWTLLTTTVFLHCIDCKGNHEEVIGNLRKLKAIDESRSGYYDDLITKWSIEDQLSNNYIESNDFKITFPEKITSLPHLQYYSYCETVDLSNQNLTSNVLPSLIVLQHCKKLSLENNNLTTLSNLPNLKLEVLNLKGNTALAQEVDAFRQKCNYNVIY